MLTKLVKSNDDKEITLLIQPARIEEERGQFAVLDAKKHAIPTSIRENKFTFVVSPRPNTEYEVNVLIRTISEQSLPVFFFGFNCVNQSIQVQFAPEYPQIVSFSVLWYTDAVRCCPRTRYW